MMKRSSVFRSMLVGVIVTGGIWLWIYQKTGADAWQVSLALLAALPFAFAAIWLPGLRLALIAGKPVTPQAGFWANAVSVTLYLILPGRLSEGAKPIILNTETDFPIVKGVAATALERLLDAAFVVGLATLLLPIGLRLNARGLGFDLGGLLFFVLGGLLGIGVLAWLGPRLFARSEARTGRMINRIVADALAIIRRLKSPWTLLLLFLVSAGIWLSSYLAAFTVLFLSGSIALSPWDVLLVFLAGTVGYIVAIAPGGLGTYEAATVLVLNSMGYPFAEGIFLAFAMRIVNIVPAVLAVAVYLTARRVTVTSLIGKIRDRQKGSSSRTPHQ